MRSSFRSTFYVPLLACALVFPSVAPLAQETHTRPRRATAKEPAAEPEPSPTPAPAPDLQRLKDEPLIRIGLTSGARSVTVSTTGRLLQISAPEAAPEPLEVARVRIEPRVYAPLPSAPPVEADSPKDGQDKTSRDRDTLASRAAPKARDDATRRPPSSTDSKTSSPAVRLTSRSNVALRGAALYAPGETRPLLDVRAPVVFASGEEAAHPLRFNEKPYRGRLEVFANTKGTLTVVNVLPLEDYVRGVVPNELSPGGWPQLEALKAQAVAARTYAVGNLGRYGAEGFDLTPDTRSQVYGGRSTEHAMTDRAVEETRGLVATFQGRPINALYTSTCGGRTEHAEHIFGGEPVPYLRARECAFEPRAALAPYAVRSTRPLPDIKSAEHATSARDSALLTVHGFKLPARLDDDWLEDFIPVEDMRELLRQVSTIARQAAPALTAEATRPPGFASALAGALDGESRGTVLLNSADVAYHLAFRDAEEVPDKHRADTALMLREGHLSLFPDGSLRPRQAMTRARVVRAVAHALEARGLLRLTKATTRPAADGALILRPAGGKGKDQTLQVTTDAFLFRGFGEGLFQVREVSLVGGEQVLYHADARGLVDFLEVRPAASGAANDRFSPFATWSESLTPSEVLSRLPRSASRVGTLLDLRVLSRGASGRVLDLEVVGTGGTAHVRGGRVRSALGLREQLFVIDRALDDAGRVTRFHFAGRGWGHGVGMCQVGAFGLARAGLSFDKILKSYYTGIQLSRLY